MLGVNPSHGPTIAYGPRIAQHVMGLDPNK